MSRLLECVPNFSVGNNERTISAIRDAFVSRPDVWLLDVHTDPDHNRSVFTVVGRPESLTGSVVQAVTTAVDLIDLRHHTGQHPRLGAADVIPFISLAPDPPQIAVDAARFVGKQLAEKLSLPIYLYGAAASQPGRTDLPRVRRGGFEWLRDQIETDRGLQPDFGPMRIHETAGATAVGARDFLVAFNVMLDTPDREKAQYVARNVRTIGGGPPGIRALGLQVAGRAQVSMNLYDLHTTTPRIAYELVKRHAAEIDVSVYASQVVGLVPEFAIGDLGLLEDLQLGVPWETVVLERRIAELVPDQRP